MIERSSKKGGLMKIALQKLSSTTAPCDVLAVCTFVAKSAGKKVTKTHKSKYADFATDKALKELDKQVLGHLLSSAKHEGFSGEIAQSFVVSTLGQTPAKAIALIGLGDEDDQSIEA